MFENLIVEFLGLAFTGLCLAVAAVPSHRPPARYARDR
jgi:hypothetical protein